MADPLVGRDAELASLVELLGSDRAVIVTGEAGIGKTSLVRAAAIESGRPILEGGGFATLAWLPYLALRRATGQALAGDPDLVAARVESVVGPDLLFVDDLQWTDPATRQVVGLLVGRIAIVVAVRYGDPEADATLTPLRSRGIATIRLSGLRPEAATTILNRRHPGASAAWVGRLVERAGGNPLLLAELSGGSGSSSTLTRAILAQVDTLSVADRRALELLALADRPLPEDAIGLSAARLRSLGLVVTASDGIAVRHALIAEAIVGGIAGARRRHLHRRLAELVPGPAERARHLLAAGRRSEAFTLATASLATVTDPRIRAVLLTVAEKTAEDDGSVWRVQAARALLAVGDPDAAVERAAIPISGDDDLRALGAAALAASLDHEGRSDEAWAVIEGTRDLRPSPGSEGAVELAIAESVVLVNRGRLDDALVVAERAAAASDPAARSYRLAGTLAALRLYAGRSDRLDELESAMWAAIEAGDGGPAAGRAMDLYYMTLALRGARPAWTVAVSAGTAIERLGFHTRATELRAEAAQALIFAAELRGALTHIDEMREEPLGLLSRQRLAYNRGLALGYLGAFDDAEAAFAEIEPMVTASFDGRGALLWCWAEVALWSGQPGRALDMGRASLGYTAFNDAEFVLPSLTVSWAEAEIGKPPSRFDRSAGYRSLAGAEPEARGLSARTSGDFSAAIDGFDEAAAAWAGFHGPRELLCRWAAADARRELGDSAAIGALGAVLADAEEIGFEPLAARIRRSLRLAGVRIAAPRRRGQLIELTAREAEVVTLIEGGLSNQEIARRLGLGRPTVARIVSSAMGKLGVDRRTQLAGRVPS